ncbi:MAG: DUF1343 domain-containing protein [Candidatus Riflebacteria bacterium]|nr:DUF1343 domain-containing protein [Candidatus Riflebacteria bacterium]
MNSYWRTIFHAGFILVFVLVFMSDVAADAASRVKLGIEVLATDHPEMVRGKRLALLVAPSSIDQSLEHSIDRLARAASIEVIFTGEPYFRPKLKGSASQSFPIDSMTSATVRELSDPMKRPSPADLGKAEMIVIDIQDIGIRYFNYVTLLAQFLELAREANLPVLVLDRPNPINARVVAGPVLELSFRSRFGVYPIPLVYGMTFGELALLFNKTFGLGAKLTVIGMEGYVRDMGFRHTGLHWMPPSDHLPEADSPLYYAITGFIGEMGVFSTGVGSTRPFHYVLAPWIDGVLLTHRLSALNLAGVRFMPASIKPFYGLFQQKRIPGVEIVIDDARLYDPVLIGVSILNVLYDLYPDKIPLRNQAVSEGLDTLLGGKAVREALLRGETPAAIAGGWQNALKSFLLQREPFLIYTDGRSPESE